MKELSEREFPIKLARTRKAYFLHYLIAIVLLVSYFIITQSTVAITSLAIGIIILLWLELARIYHVLEITDKQVSIRMGIFNVKHKTVYCTNISNMEIEQNIFGSIFSIWLPAYRYTRNIRIRDNYEEAITST